jgi:hypothetical protein
VCVRLVGVGRRTGCSALAQPRGMGAHPPLVKVLVGVSLIGRRAKRSRLIGVRWLHRSLSTVAFSARRVIPRMSRGTICTTVPYVCKYLCICVPMYTAPLRHARKSCATVCRPYWSFACSCLLLRGPPPSARSIGRSRPLFRPRCAVLDGAGPSSQDSLHFSRPLLLCPGRQ